MAETTIENVMAQARQLPFQDRQRLLVKLTEELHQTSQPNGNRKKLALPFDDRHREQQWLRANAQAYRGQWVALAGDQLLASGTDGVSVYAEAQAQGVLNPLLVQVESPDDYPFGFWL